MGPRPRADFPRSSPILLKERGREVSGIEIRLPVFRSHRIRTYRFGRARASNDRGYFLLASPRCPRLHVRFDTPQPSRDWTRPRRDSRNRCSTIARKTLRDDTPERISSMLAPSRLASPAGVAAIRRGVALDALFTVPTSPSIPFLRKSTVDPCKIYRKHDRDAEHASRRDRVSQRHRTNPWAESTEDRYPINAARHRCQGRSSSKFLAAEKKPPTAAYILNYVVDREGWRRPRRDEKRVVANTWVGGWPLVGQGTGNCIACHIIVGVFPIKIHVGTALAVIPSRINIFAS